MVHGDSQPVSQEIAFLRKVLLQGLKEDYLDDSAVEEPSAIFARVARGEIPLAITVTNADIIAKLIDL